MSPSAQRYEEWFNAHVQHGTWTQRPVDYLTTDYTCPCGATHCRAMEPDLPMREVLTPLERLALVVLVGKGLPTVP